MLAGACFLYTQIYDYRNSLVKVESKTTGRYSTVVEYLYDGLNRRVKKDKSGVAGDVLYLYDGWRVIEERVWVTYGSSWWASYKQYVHGDRYIDELLRLDVNNTRSSDNDCDNYRFPHVQDANWNVVLILQEGVWDTKCFYTPYGEIWKTLTSESSQGGGTFSQYRFQGRYYDADAELYYFRNRWYHPKLGRFLQRDPSAYADGVNLYEFVSGRPLAAADPLGLRECKSTPTYKDVKGRPYYGAWSCPQVNWWRVYVDWVTGPVPDRDFGELTVRREEAEKAMQKALGPDIGGAYSGHLKVIKRKWTKEIRDESCESCCREMKKLEIILQVWHFAAYPPRWQAEAIVEAHPRLRKLGLPPDYPEFTEPAKHPVNPGYQPWVKPITQEELEEAQGKSEYITLKETPWQKSNYCAP